MGVQDGLSQPLRTAIFEILQSARADVGVAIKHLETGDTVSFSGRSRFPMQSVFKFPLAMAVLHSVDEGKLLLQQKVPVRKEDFILATWSPIAKKYPNGNVELTVEQLLRYTVSESDNNGCDILFRLLGGPAAVADYIRNLGIKGISIIHTEAEMHQDWNVQFKNWAEPQAMVRLLELFHHGKLFSRSSQDLLMEMMLKTITGRDRIKGLLPENTDVAHRTGMSATDDHGVRAALNDVGIVSLPNGNHFAIAVFISDTKDDTPALEALIAKIAKVSYDHFALK
jgi:beta-lactamase class A